MLVPSSSAAHPSGPDLTSTRGDREPVEVRTEAVDGVATPAQLLRGGRLWVVRSAEALPGAAARWRVDATPGPGVRAVPLELADDDGRWSLVQPAAAEPAEPAWA